MPHVSLPLVSLPTREPPLSQRLFEEQFSATGDLHYSVGKGRVRCLACAHRCVIAEGLVGVCGVRGNRDGQLRVPSGYVARRHVRAVETNTVFHLLPGARSLTFGMYGCDVRCPYCQDHRLSQALRAGIEDEQPTAMSAEALVEEALSAGASVVCAAYSEPMISAEWIRAVFRVARTRGLRTAVVSDGHSTPEALRYLRSESDVFRVDLKAHTEAAYKKLGGRLRPVLDSIALARELGYWVEVVTLVVPGINQEQTAIAQLGAQLREISPSIPWHLNGFVPRHRMMHVEPASEVFLMKAVRAAYVAGSKFVYVGNSLRCQELAHTRCPECRFTLIERRDYAATSSALRQGTCPSCSTRIPGVWT